MTSYEADLPVKVAFPKLPRMENIAGEYLSRLGLHSAAETEKYAHVTFFSTTTASPSLGKNDSSFLLPQSQLMTNSPKCRPRKLRILSCAHRKPPGRFRSGQLRQS